MLQYSIIRSTFEDGAFHECVVTRLGKLYVVTSHDDVQWSRHLLSEYDHRHRPAEAARPHDG
jgi:hypothetical protein